MTINWQPFVAAVQSNDTFLLTSHMRPDCDALGSEIGLAGALRAFGKQAWIVNGDTVPPHIAFIDPNREVLTLEHLAPDSPSLEPEVFIVLDTSAWSQLGPMGDVLRNSQARKICIDHHVSADDLGAENFKDTSSESTGRLVLEATAALGVDVTPEMARAIFAAIATDTGWFRFASVTEKTLSAAAQLVAAGARPAEAFAELYETNSLARLWLQGRILSRATTDLDGRLIYSSVVPSDFTETGAELTDTEDVVNRLLSVAGVEAGLLFLELQTGETKVSLRSRSDVDVRKIAEQFGGGGHTAAAGVRYPASLEEASKAILDVVRNTMK